ncbi:MAG TPA: amidohydrolase family protein [Thermoanaerobaculia bacterium]|jgi:imidazolonepropionase-like amidohydrolase|nr:amidohydrolase family protein [Thermoanaerobaculia bacterium]
MNAPLLALLFVATSVVGVSTPSAVLEHVNVIDGTGAPAQPDRNVVIENGKIAAITPGADVTAHDGVTVLDLRGDSVMPGIVGMHDHLDYIRYPNIDAAGNFDRPSLMEEMAYSAPRLYLANGVTTIRTTGSINPYEDLRLKEAIDAGTIPGPHMDVTGPYLEGANPGGPLTHYQLRDANDARQTVAYWAERGVTSFKGYVHITRDELRAAIDEAHKHGLKVTGHLCSVTYPEAIEAGIDNLEHGFFTNTQLDPDKKPDVCSASQGDATLEKMRAGTPEAEKLIAMLVGHHVAITSTLPNSAAASAPRIEPGALEAMSPSARETYLYWRNRTVNKASESVKHEMELERAFVAAGGLLIAGPDPVGVGGNVPGFADHREIELLVEAGFTPLEAIRIATFNGAKFLGRDDRIGSIAAGRNADLVVVKGDPAAHIEDIEKVEIVFKDGVGYDSRKLLDSVKGTYGDY